MRIAKWIGFMLLAGCGGGQIKVEGSDRATGADGIVDVDEVEGSNYLIHLEMQHLPPPGRIASGMKLYAVWFVPKGGAAVRAGTLDYDQDERTGVLSATTPFKSFELRVTAESERDAGSPGPSVALSKKINAED